MVVRGRARPQHRGLAAVAMVSSSVVADVVIVLVANAVVSAGRFVSFRGRTFRQHREALATGAAAS